MGSAIRDMLINADQDKRGDDRSKELMCSVQPSCRGSIHLSASYRSPVTSWWVVDIPSRSLSHLA